MKKPKIIKRQIYPVYLSSLIWNLYSTTLPFCYCNLPLYHWHCFATLLIYSTILPLTICSYSDSKNTYKLDFIDLNIGLVSFVLNKTEFDKKSLMDNVNGFLAMKLTTLNTIAKPIVQTNHWNCPMNFYKGQPIMTINLIA